MIEKLVAGVAMRQGALAAKVCGAGGGGCVVLLTEPENRDHISAAIRSYGGQVLPALVARDGLTVSGRTLRGGVAPPRRRGTPPPSPQLGFQRA